MVQMLLLSRYGTKIEQLPIEFVKTVPTYQALAYVSERQHMPEDNITNSAEKT